MTASVSRALALAAPAPLGRVPRTGDPLAPLDIRLRGRRGAPEEAVYAPPHIKAQAVCEPAGFDVADPIRDQPFLVTVTGELYATGDKLKPRVYEIAAENEPAAAFAGINRYLAEMQRVN